jgi:hypothetical protein
MYGWFCVALFTNKGLFSKQNNTIKITEKKDALVVMIAPTDTGWRPSGYKQAPAISAKMS